MLKLSLVLIGATSAFHPVRSRWLLKSRAFLKLCWRVICMPIRGLCRLQLRQRTMRWCQRKSSIFPVKVPVVFLWTAVFLASSFWTGCTCKDGVVGIYISFYGGFDCLPENLLDTHRVPFGVFFKKLMLSLSHSCLNNLHAACHILNEWWGGGEI